MKIRGTIFLIVSLLALFAYKICLGGFFVESEMHIPHGKMEFGINYFSQGLIWRDFWESYDPEKVDGDMKTIKQLDLSTIRVFLYQEYFASQSTHASAMKKLRHLLDSAQASELKVIVTLFDWSKPYSFEIQNSTESRNFELGASEVMDKFANHPAVLAWDLKNEPDHDFVSDGRSKVSDWLLNASAYLKKKWPKSRFTVGWLWIFGDLKVNQELDFLSFHHFPEQGIVEDRILRFQKDFPVKSILLEEVGKSTYLVGDPSREEVQQFEEQQSLFLSNAIAQSIRYKLMGTLIWTLRDHPAHVGAKRPPAENNFGIFRLDGSPKPSAKMITGGIYTATCDNGGISGLGLRLCVSSFSTEAELQVTLRNRWLSSSKVVDIYPTPGLSCYCLSGPTMTLFRKTNGEAQIQHKGLATLAGSSNVAPGVVVVSLSKKSEKPAN